ncbi:B12-binding domain-containing radical SAM protein [Desulfuromonas versatilis]|uniref:B12-binding domain-containing radical SAM protein n=1 Tax=Desulfuromonas versatilis TaxID=2802975 RepID=A0ABN6E7P0_9BACT|nr:B12-binding domain-containing radical SAM protein [Desulfuromonas versatilis]BCR06731.1 B12-binding domain-containing radical SAM protein [Desulfuromonas versatilis]
MNIALATLHANRSAQAVPLAAACLAAALPEGLRRKTRLVDLYPDQDQEAMVRALLAANPQLVAFSLYVWNREALLALARRLRRERPALRLVAGGPEATTDPAGVLRDGDLDAVIRGEGEASFRELVEALEQGPLRVAPAGVTLNTPEGPVAGPERAPAEDLDALASPWLSGVLTPPAGGGVLWEVSRGCPFACDFCFDARGSRGVRHIGEKRLVAELKLFARARVGQVWVLDSTFNFPPERGKNLLRLLARHAPQVHFHLEAKADFLDRETARLLADTPCSVQIGLQSARPEVLRNIHRNLDLAAFGRRLQQLGAEGVTFGLDLIYGLPGDDHQGFRHSLNTALGFAPNHLDMFALAVLPGTPLHRDRERFGIVAEEQPPYRVLGSASCPPADLERSRSLAAAADLFYNVGRAVAFFPALLKATGTQPAEFLEGFAEWALGPGGVESSRFLDALPWKPAAVLALQEGYVTERLRRAGREELVPAALDLMRYHFHYAETLLGPETLPLKGKTPRGQQLWNTPLRTAGSLRLVPFNYEILEMVELGDIDLAELAAMFRPVGSMVLFVRRGDQVFCESLVEDFARLLGGCQKKRAPKEIFGASLSSREGAEIVEFAVAEGFLVRG